MIQNLLILNCGHFLVDFVWVSCKVDIFVEAASSWTSSWIRWRLSLPLYTFYNFSSLRIYATEWIHLAIFTMRIISTVICNPVRLSSWTLNLWRHHLASRSMLHIFWISDRWCYVHLPIYNDGRLLVRTYVRRLLPPITSCNLNIIIWCSLFISLSIFNLNCLIKYPLILNRLGQYLRSYMYTLTDILWILLIAGAISNNSVSWRLRILRMSVILISTLLLLLLLIFLTNHLF